jgi:hypothetical protein
VVKPETTASLAALIALWVFYGIVAKLVLAPIRKPVSKLLVFRIFAIAAGPLWLWSVWVVPGTTRDLITAGITITVILGPTIALVRGCDRCAAIAYPQLFYPARFCSTCGAAIDSSAGTSPESKYRCCLICVRADAS